MGLPHPRRSHTSRTSMQKYLESTTDWFVFKSEKHHLEKQYELKLLYRLQVGQERPSSWVDFSLEQSPKC